MTLTPKRGLALAALLWLAGVAVCAAAPRLVASVPPLHAVVAAVADGVAEPYLLLRGGASPHTYSLRPSDMRALERADAVFWIGPELETFLERPLAGLSARTLAAVDLPGIERLPARVAGAWEQDTHGDDDHGDDDHGHQHRGGDPHLWLDPDNAATIARAAAAWLSEIDPDNGARYGRNLERFEQRLAVLRGDLERRLAPLRERPYIVFHDAYQYFEHAFGLHPAGAVTISPDRRPGARRLTEIRAQIRHAGAVCVFSEPQFRAALVEVVLEDTGARHGVLDPLGADLAPGPDLYFELLDGLASSLVACLGGR